MSMKLTEDIQRVKNLMGLNSLTEGLFRKTGKLKDLLGKEIDLSKVESPVDKKYGKLIESDAQVTSIMEQRTTQENGKYLNYTIQILFVNSVGNIPLPSDPTKKVSQTSCSLQLQTKIDTKIDYYGYNKIYFNIDGVKTDVMSQVKQGQTFTCVSNTLNNKPGECKIDDKILEKINTVFKDDQEVLNMLAKLY